MLRAKGSAELAMTADAFRTHHASQALEISELVNLTFARTTYGAAQPRLLRMRKPDGPSTDAGRKARQPLVLVEHKDDETGFVIGFADVYKRIAELRGYPSLRHTYEQRYGQPLPLTRPEHARLVEDIKGLLESQMFEVRLVNAQRTPLPPGPSSSPSIPPTAAARPSIHPVPLVVSVAIGFALCYLLFLLRVLSV